MSEHVAGEPVTAEVVAEGLNRKYLCLHDLKRLQHVAFASRRPIEGLYSGQHRTAQRGQSVEFRDYRAYIPGDDVGGVDWKVYGRSDKLFVKLYEHQAELTVHLLVDASASMAYGGLRKGGETKYDHACFLAAAIAFLIAKQTDRVSFAAARAGLSHAQRPGNSMLHLVGLLQAMEQVAPSGEAQLAAAIRALWQRAGRRDLLIVLSDLLEPRDEILKALDVGLHRGGEAIMFHVLHDDELRLPPVDNGLFIDSETGGRIRLNVPDIRAGYESRMQELLDAWRDALRGRGVDYNLAPVSTAYEKTLQRYLQNRTRR